MSKKETKQKRKDIPGVSMAELVQRGDLDQYAHLEEVDTKTEDKKSFTEWLKVTDNANK